MDTPTDHQDLQDVLLSFSQGERKPLFDFLVKWDGEYPMDLWRLTAAMFMHKPPEKITKKQRMAVKHAVLYDLHEEDGTFAEIEDFGRYTVRQLLKVL